jgi:hypothetical protein
MDGSSEVTASAAPVERFKPTNGFVLGYISLALAAVVLAYSLFGVHTLTGVRVAIAMVFVGTVIWTTQIRPRAALYSRVLELRNSLRDTWVPLELVEDVDIGTFLSVWADERRYVCIGIGRGRRPRKRRNDGPSLLGKSRWREFADMADKAAPDQSAMAYETWVVRRIEELSDGAKKEAAADAPRPAVRRTVAWLEVGLLVGSALAFVVTLFI